MYNYCVQTHISRTKKFNQGRLKENLNNVFYTKALFLEKHHGGSKQRERKDKKTEMSFLVGGSKKTTW